MAAATGKYLCNVLKYVSVKIHNTEPCTYTNALFTAMFTRDQLVFTAQCRDVPALKLLAALDLDKGMTIVLTKEDDGTLTGVSHGQVPVRWFYMLKDFSQINIDICVDHNPTNFQELLERMPEDQRTTVCTGARVWSTYCLTVAHPDWDTPNCSFTKYTKDILSVPRLSYDKYVPLAACEGGICINNEYCNEWIDFNHSFPWSGSIRNECKGRRRYVTCKDVTPEELVVISEILRTSGCSYTIKKI